MDKLFSLIHKRKKKKTENKLRKRIIRWQKLFRLIQIIHEIQKVKIWTIKGQRKIDLIRRKNFETPSPEKCYELYK